MIRHVAWWVGLWVALFWLWLLLAGDWNRYEWIAAASAATIGATLGEIARVRAEIEVRVPLRWVAQAWTVPAMIVVDFGILVWALLASAVRRKVVRGVFRSHPFPAGGDDPTSLGIRAWAGWTANFSPNAYVVDLDGEKKRALLHDLVPYRKSEEPA